MGHGMFRYVQPDNDEGVELPDVRASIYETAKSKVSGTCEQAWHSKDCALKLQQASSTFKTCAQPAGADSKEPAPSCDDCATAFDKAMEPCKDHAQTMAKANSMVASVTDTCKKAAGTGTCALRLRDASSELSTCTQAAVSSSDANECATCMSKFDSFLGDCKETLKQASDSTRSLASSACESLQDKVQAYSSLKSSMQNLRATRYKVFGASGPANSAEVSDDDEEFETADEDDTTSYQTPAQASSSTPVVVIVVAAIAVAALCVALFRPRSRSSSGRMQASSDSEGQ